MGHFSEFVWMADSENPSLDHDQPWGDAPAAALEAVIRCYPRLRGLVHEAVRRHAAGQNGSLTNSPTALTHELMERLVGQRRPFRNDEHMMALASKFAIQIIISDQRRRLRAKRGGGDRGNHPAESVADPRSLQDCDDNRDAFRMVLTRFSSTHPREAEVVSLRFLFGLTNAQVADAVGISVPTVERDWEFARAWLGQELRRQGFVPNADR